jgi:hypothetical protein
MRTLLVLAALSLATRYRSPPWLPTKAPPAIGVEADAKSNATYWLRKREGWFWYRDPPEPLPPPKESPPSPIRPPELVGSRRCKSASTT